MGNIDLKQKLPASLNEFRLLTRQAIDHRERFWAGQARRLKWQKDFAAVVQEDFSQAEVSWFLEGRLNPTENALHRIIEKGMGEKSALTFYPEDGAAETYTFSALKEKVLNLAAAFSREGLTQGDCIALNLPNCPEFVFCALAAAYLGVTYLPIGCHLPAALVADDVRASHSKLLIMEHRPPLGNDKPHVETVHSLLGSLGIIIVGEKLKGLPTLEEFAAHTDSKDPEPAYPRANHPLFAIYENRLAGKPVGIVFDSGGFLVQAHTSFDAVFNKALNQNEPENIFNTLDPSKSVGQAYGLWGPLTNGLGIVIAEDNSGIHTIETILEEQGNPAMLCHPGLVSDIKNQLDREHLKTDKRFSIIACCGESLPPRLIKFADGVLVKAPEFVVNMWVQNKCGTALLHTYPSPELNRPGSLGFGTLGVEPLIMNDFGQICKTNISGNLVFARSWPSMGRATWGAETHFKKTCFTKFPNHFQTYDGVRFDKDGFHWFMGRLDDVIKVKGQTLGTSQIEAMILSHPAIEEAVVVSTAGESGEELVVFVVTREPIQDEDTFITLLNTYITEKVGHFAVPEKIVIARELPRTSTGKLVRRLLRRIASGDAGANEDTSHLANAESVKDLIKKHEE